MESTARDAARAGLVTLSAVGPDVSMAHAWGVAHGSLGAVSERAIVEALRANDDPVGAPDAPWAAVVVRPDGTIAAAASTEFTGGLFWTWESSSRERLLLAAAPGPLVRARARATHLSEEFVRGYALLTPGPSSSTTPYREVHRVRPGTTVVWGRGVAVPKIVEWCGASAWPAPTVQGEGALKRYRDTFDATVDSLVAAGEPLVATLSGGLDSSFVVASLVRHATTASPVHALCHSPHPDAALEPVGQWDADDFDVAMAMERAYPGRVVVHRVRRPEGVFPLDVAEAAAVRGWLPIFNSANQQWLEQMSQQAAELGASRLFVGSGGNASFSHGHEYAVRHYLRRGSLAGAWGSIDPDHAGRVPSRSAVRSRLVSPLVASGRVWIPKRGPRAPSYGELIGLGHEPLARPRPMSRATFLRWMSLDTVLTEAMAFPLWPAPLVDPFVGRGVLDLAAAITPREWSRGPQPRGYARLLGEGRVPDEIRLRTRRGGQSWDHWYLMRNQRDRYYDEVGSLAATPVLGGWVDDSVLRRELDSWPWGEVAGPSAMSLTAMDRMLSLAAFVRLTTVRLAATG